MWLEFVAEAGPGDFNYVPTYLPHQEINARSYEPLECVLCRSGVDPVFGDNYTLAVTWPETLPVSRTGEIRIFPIEHGSGAAQDHQDQGRLPIRRGGQKTALPGSAQSVPKVDTAAFKLEGRYQPVHHHVRGQSALHVKQSVTQNRDRPQTHDHLQSHLKIFT